jgi:hypothetical protein
MTVRVVGAERLFHSKHAWTCFAGIPKLCLKPNLALEVNETTALYSPVGRRMSRHKVILQKMQMRKLLVAQMARILFSALGRMLSGHMLVQLKLSPSRKYTLSTLMLLGHMRPPPMLIHQRIVLELLLANVALQRRTVLVSFLDVHRIAVDHHQVVGLVDPIAHIAPILGMLGFHVNGPLFARRKIDLTKVAFVDAPLFAMDAHHVLVELEAIFEGFFAATHLALTVEILGCLVDFFVLVHVSKDWNMEDI